MRRSAATPPRHPLIALTLRKIEIPCRVPFFYHAVIRLLSLFSPLFNRLIVDLSKSATWIISASLLVPLTGPEKALKPVMFAAGDDVDV